MSRLLPTVDLAALPPQVCSLALGANGLAALLAHWARVLGPSDGELLKLMSFCCSVLAAWLVLSYGLTSLLLPGKVLKDFNSLLALPALNAGIAAVQGLAVRFGTPLAPQIAQSCIVASWVVSIAISLRFLVLSYRLGSWPDPSWFPAVLLPGMTNVTAHVAGPATLKALMPYQLCLLLVIYAPIKVVVAYRLLLSPTRDMTAPHAGMALLMAPGSFFAMAYLSTGKPFGDWLGLLLFIDSTMFFLVTLQMLFKRRKVWAGAFHVSYVAFTFPAASTATAALLASERLALLAGVRFFQAWAAILGIMTFLTTLAVVVRFMWHLCAIVKVDFGGKALSKEKTK